MTPIELTLRYIAAGALIVLCGYILAEITYWFIWAHWKAYVVLRDYVKKRRSTNGVVC